MVFRRLLVAVVLVLSAWTTACSAGVTATQAGRPDAESLVVALSGGPQTLDFTHNGGANIPQALMGNVYETLVTVDADGQIVPLLATSWEVSADRTRYTFQLRENVYFSNGAPFNAESAAFSIDNVRNNWTNGLSAQMAPVAEVHPLDEFVLEVRLSQPSNRWLWSMATLTGAMMTETGVDNLASSPVGTGPFEVTRFVARESINFSARDDYWGTPARRDVAMNYFPTETGAMNAWLTDDADVVYGIQEPELLAMAGDDAAIDVGTTNGEVLLSMNNLVAPFDDVRVRQAVAYAIDRQALNQVVWESMGVDTGAAPVAPTDPWFSGTEYAPFDPDRARTLLAEAGYGPGNPPKVTFSVPNRSYTENLSEYVYSALRDVGFDISLEATEFPAVWLSQVMGAADYQMSVIAHVEPRDIPALFGNPDGYLRYDNPEVRALLNDADTAASLPEETADMRRAVDTLMDDMPAVTLVNLPSIIVSSPEVTGIRATNPLDFVDLAALSISSPRDGR